MLATNRVIIGIATFQRPQELARLLRSLAKLQCPPDCELSILVADNEGANGEGTEQCKRIQPDFPIPLSTVAVPEQGISNARNAILEHAFLTQNAHFVAMIDDDEVASENWLVELLAMHIKTGADLVGGKKTPRFTGTPENWMPANDVFYYEPSSRNGLCKRLVSTDNLLISADGYFRLGQPKFDVSFNLTGGGDTEFLHRLSKMGAKLAYSKTAISEEIIPHSRMSIAWARQRSYRIGIGLARIDMLHRTSFLDTVLAVFKLVGILFAAAILYCVFLVDRPRRVKYEMLFIKQLGKIAGYFGRRVEPYKSPDS